MAINFAGMLFQHAYGNPCSNLFFVAGFSHRIIRLDAAGFREHIFWPGLTPRIFNIDYLTVISCIGLRWRALTALCTPES